MSIANAESGKVMGYLSATPAVDIEFQDLLYSVPNGKKGEKLLLKAISGHFKSGELTAILGPSGAGKTTLLNSLAGFKCKGKIKGSVWINGQPKNTQQFRKISRYIMQDDLIQPMLTVDEAMMMAADLKLEKTMEKREKSAMIDEILNLLRLFGTKNTLTNHISGGERRRLSIALELLNNPPVLFLDEPTTGLDDMACSQCISLLKIIAQGGRTVICSIHTPSAKLFKMFDNVYVMSYGQCAYQGYGPDSIKYLSELGLECPTHFNPADFVIEVCSGEYGNYQDKLVSAIDNGKRKYNEKVSSNQKAKEAEMNRTTSMPNHDFERINWLKQFWIIITRMWIQMYRDKSHLFLQFVLYIALGLVIGISYYGIGQDASLTLINSRFLFASIVVFIYIPLMPVLLYFPQKVKILRKEHFNKWYNLSAYFCALSFHTIPFQMFLGMTYVTLVYFLSDQPQELDRFLMFSLVCLLTGITAESFGQLVSAHMTLVNGMFLGPCLLAPLLILAVYGLGSGYDTIPTFVKFMMKFSFIRYAVEGTSYAMFERREKLKCPPKAEFCYYTDLHLFAHDMGIQSSNFVVDLVALVVMSAIFRAGSFYLLKQRLTPNKTFIALHSVGDLIKSHLSSHM